MPKQKTHKGTKKRFRLTAKGKAKQAALAARVSAMERSWTDELIAVIWFSPLARALASGH